MTAILEREIKLRFDSADAARAAVLATGASPVHSRRLQEDCLLDTLDEVLHRRRCVLRLRMEPGKSLLTFKGPVQPADMKLREELETVVGDGPLVLRVLEELGFHAWFRYETPVGTFVEIEGGDRGIAEMALALGRSPADYLFDSYRGLFVEHCRRRGQPVTEMLFDSE